MIKLIIKNKEELFKEIAKIYVEEINENPKTTLGMATGSSPIGVYEELVKAYNTGEISFADITTFNLDEYCNLDINDKNSYHTFMNENLFSKVDINIKNTNFPGTTPSTVDEYNTLLENNPISIQLLGLGSNGHIAFNEPGSSFDSKTRIVDLDEKTISDNSRFFNSPEEVPTQASSMGLANIMSAKKIILIALGEGKQEILKEIFANDNITENIPATILKKHPDVTFYVDDIAGKFLK